jgi:uncharacterized repeat protein (TIGR02543 family)
MPYCPNCGTEVSEGTQFCPECGRRLTTEQKVKRMSKKKLAGIIVGCIIGIIIITAIIAGITTPTHTYKLSVSVSPSGAGSFSPSGGEYESGVQVTLTANPISDYTFDYWSGSASGTTPTITITMDSDKSLTANFKATSQTYSLTTNISPSGAGLISPSSGEYESDVQVTLTASPASGYTFDYWSGSTSGTTSTITITMDSDKSLTANFKITSVPAHFTTYTDELGLFSISYPSEWEPALEYLEETEQAVRDVLSSINSDLSVEEASCIFIVGLPIKTGYMPNVNIMVEPLPNTIWTHDQMVTAEIEGLKAIVSDYHEFSRVKTTIDNRTATIIECQGTMAGFGTFHDVLMCCIAGKNIWSVICTALPNDYSKSADDFNAIVRSLRILK